MLATASMLYELILAQILNISLGGTIFQYTITIGIYATSLGVGSLVYQISNQTIFKNKDNSLYAIELIIAFLGISSVFFAYILQYYFFTYNLPLIGFQLIIYFLIFSIGFLSGLELPLLMDITNKNSNSFESNILFVDYLGTLMGCILFPLLFIPFFNLIETLFITAAFNLLVAGLLTNALPKRLAAFSLLLLTIFGIYVGSELSSWLSMTFVA